MSIDKRLDKLEAETTVKDGNKTLDDWCRQFDDPKYKQEFLKKWYGNESE